MANPTLVVADLPALARIAHDHGAQFVVDNTFSPLILSPIVHGADVVVGTPGRILDHLERGSLSLAGVNTLVLDEADRMLDMGFFEDMATVIKQCPKDRQTLLFSATYPEGIGKLAAQFMRDPLQITVQAPPGGRHSSLSEADLSLYLKNSSLSG